MESYLHCHTEPAVRVLFQTSINRAFYVRRMSAGRSDNGEATSLSHVQSARSISELSEGDASLNSLVRQHVPQAVIVSRGPAEISFRLPKEETSRQEHGCLSHTWKALMYAAAKIEQYRQWPHKGCLGKD